MTLIREHSEEETTFLLKMINEYIYYDSINGTLTWKKSKSGVKVGNTLGTLHRSGYLCCKLNQVIYSLHRVIWLIETGSFPEMDIDHIDHDKTNNRFSNLRLVTCQENHKNRPMSKSNQSGQVGVIWNKASKMWYVTIGGNYIGRYKDKAKAIRARKRAELEYKYHPNNGKPL